MTNQRIEWFWPWRLICCGAALHDVEFSSATCTSLREHRFFFCFGLLVQESISEQIRWKVVYARFW